MYTAFDNILMLLCSIKVRYAHAMASSPHTARRPSPHRTGRHAAACLPANHDSQLCLRTQHRDCNGLLTVPRAALGIVETAIFTLMGGGAIIVNCGALGGKEFSNACCILILHTSQAISWQTDILPRPHSRPQNPYTSNDYINTLSAEIDLKRNEPSGPE